MFNFDYDSHWGDTWCIIILSVGMFSAGVIACYSLMCYWFPKKMTKEEARKLHL